jgi:hypothetical protein
MLGSCGLGDRPNILWNFHAKSRYYLEHLNITYMAMSFFGPVSTYRVLLFSDPNYDLRSFVIISATTSTNVKFAAQVAFVKTGKALPGVSENLNTRTLNVFLPETAYDMWIDLLRNEKPLELSISGLSAQLSCGTAEPVGAHEIGG